MGSHGFSSWLWNENSNRTDNATEAVVVAAGAPVVPRTWDMRLSEQRRAREEYKKWGSGHGVVTLKMEESGRLEDVGERGTRIEGARGCTDE